MSRSAKRDETRVNVIAIDFLTVGHRFIENPGSAVAEKAHRVQLVLSDEIRSKEITFLIESEGVSPLAPPH